MATITLTQISNGDSLDATTVDNNFDTIAAEVNGNLDDSNIKTGANIDGAKLANDSVPTSKFGAGAVVASGYIQTGAVATGTTTIPLDDTVPQNTEGTEFLTLAHTPTSATNRLVIEAVINCSPSVDAFTIAAIFQDSTANALAVGYIFQQSGPRAGQVFVRHEMIAGTAATTTFKVRAGMTSAGTLTFNGRGGTRDFGGSLASSLRITEIQV